MPGRRCMTCADPRALNDGDVLRELALLALGPDARLSRRGDRGDGIAPILRRLRTGGACAELDDDALLDDVARGWGAGDAEAQVYVLREIKDALGARAARADPTLKAPAAARAERVRRAADAEVRAVLSQRKASARAARVRAASGRRPVSALERLSGDAGRDSPADAPAEPTFDGLSTLRRLAGEPSGDFPGEADAANLTRDADPGSETGSLRDWGRGEDADARARERTKRVSGPTDANTSASDVSSASAYAAAADAAEAAAHAYASRAEEARRARSAFLEDEAAARRAASTEGPSPRLATSPEANDARRGFRGGTPPPADAAFLPTPRDSAQAWARGGARVPRLTPEQQDAVVWVLGLGVEVAGAVVNGDVVVSLPRSTGVQAEMAKGALLCRLAETLEGTHLGETHRRPKVKAEATHNINKALAVFRSAGRVAPRHLWSAAELAAGDEKTTWGALFDIRAAYDAGFDEASKKTRSENASGGRVRGRRLRVTPRVDARGGAYGDPGDVTAAEAGEGRLPRTPPRGGTGAPFRERNADVSASAASAPKAGAFSKGASWRRAAPGVPLTARGLPSPLARAAAKVAAARAKRVARLMGDADRAEKTAKVRRAVAADAAATATRAAFEAAAAEAELEASEEAEALLALEAAARADAAERAERGKMRDGAAGARFSRGGAVKGALSRDAKARAEAARAARPDFVPSGYVSPNERARRHERVDRERNPKPASLSVGEVDVARSAARGYGKTKPEHTEKARVNALARRAAETAALAGAVPVVFEFREGPLPTPPESSTARDEEVRAWLATLGLSVLPREEEADLLSNPLRNGTLLRDVVTVLVGAPPLTRRERAPRTLDAARANVEKALAPLRAVPGAIPPGLTWSTEGVLKGVREHTFGLLWYVKRAALGRVAGSEARRKESLEKAALRSDGREPFSFARNPGGSRDGPPAAGVLGGGLARASTPARSRRLLDDFSAHVSAFGAETTDGSRDPSPPLYAGVPTAEGGARARREDGGNAAPTDGAFGANAVGASASESVSPADRPTVGGDGVLRRSPNGRTANGFARALGYEALPLYSPENVRRLETSVVRWLAKTGTLGDERTVANASFVALCPRLATGVPLCDLVAAIEGVPVVGVFRDPRSVKCAEANARRACERLARHKSMSRRFLFRAGDVAAGVVGVLLGLLEDIRVFHDGKPPRVDGSKKWDLRVPYCPDDELPESAFAHGTPAAASALPSRFASPAVPPGSADAANDSAVSDSEDDASLAGASAGASAEPSPVAGGPTRVAASVDGVDPEPSGEKKSEAPGRAKTPRDEPPPSPRLADAPEAAARAAAAALEGWRDGVAKDLVGAETFVTRSRFIHRAPAVSTTRARGDGRGGSVGGDHAWARGSFPRTRATPAETERREKIESAARAARAVADLYAEPSSRVSAPSPGGAPRELSTAARARAAERARKESAAAHAEAEKKTPSLVFGTRTSASRTRPTTSARSSASREPETVTKPRLRPPKPPPTEARSFPSRRDDAPPESFAAPAPSPPRTFPRTRADASPNAARRPVRFVPAPSPEARKREARDRDAIRAARWIESLGVSTRRAGASGASSRSGSRRGENSETSDPFAEATRAPAAELAAVCADGTLLCELVRVLEKVELAGVTWRPASNASRAHNVGKALAAMRRQPAMSPMHLWSERDIVAADEEAVLGLLGDMRACAAYKRAGRR